MLLSHVSLLVHAFLLLLSFTFIKHFYLAEVLFTFAWQQAATVSELIIFDLQMSLNLQCVGMSVNDPCTNYDLSDSSDSLVIIIEMNTREYNCPTLTFANTLCYLY
jgi:hypothetical protein